MINGNFWDFVKGSEGEAVLWYLEQGVHYDYVFPDLLW